jgi:ATP-dependent DNA helicase RecG
VSTRAPVERVVSPDTPIQFVKNVGEGRAKLFKDLGIETVRDLLYFFPNRYEDRRKPVRIADIRGDEPVLLRGRVTNAHERAVKMGRMRIFQAMLDDGSGTAILTWFNQPYLAEQINRGDFLSVYGQPKRTAMRLQLDSPAWEKLDEEDAGGGAIVPIYPKVGNIAPKTLRKIIETALPAAALLPDPMPAELRKRFELIGLADAIRQLHDPPELSDAMVRGRSPAHRRLILQEFFTFQLALRVRRASEEQTTKTRTISITDELRKEVGRILPFKLTEAQKRVVREIAGDLLSTRPMYRLLQGDVGSGKTIVALIAALFAIRNGHQVALLAPTEILVEQHYQRIRQLVDGSVRMAKATGSMSAGERRTLIAGLRDGYLELVIGTHALLEERVQFKSLGLAIVDEQHRFGVEQRQKLFRKGDLPDILVMTATPIPRSLALAIYGDLELSVIDELPPGRQKIKTVVRGSTELERVFTFLDKEIEDGAQAYVVFPIIEESEKTSLKPLTQGFERLQQRFPSRRLAMLHGRMPSAEKEETMQRFKRGELDVLVSTTVIEVGIDVPNASMMLIFDAGTFGLSQLHQLRGRVGRGERKSYCVLIRDESANEESKQRLQLFEATKDGFDVAERDLELRGAGEFLGTRQSGAARFRFGNILRDHDLMETARDAAIDIVENEGLGKATKIVKGLIGEFAVGGVGRD